MSIQWSGERLLDGEVAVFFGKEGSEWSAAKELLNEVSYMQYTILRESPDTKCRVSKKAGGSP